jgi:hypothetical protein
MALKKIGDVSVGEYWAAFCFLLFGVISSVLAAAFSYYTQYEIFRHDRGGWFFSVAKWSAIMSVIMFIAGSISGAIFIGQFM